MSIATGDINGGQGAGILNVVLGDITKFQVAGMANFAGGNLAGPQMSGLVNISHGVNDGVQIGVLNIAKQAKKLQLGVVNIATKNDGMALGLINAIGNGRFDIGVSYDESKYRNLLMKSGARNIYNQFSLGEKYEKRIRDGYIGVFVGESASIKSTMKKFLWIMRYYWGLDSNKVTLSQIVKPVVIIPPY